jgi:hypothetical protein
MPSAFVRVVTVEQGRQQTSAELDRRSAKVVRSIWSIGNPVRSPAWPEQFRIRRSAPQLQHPLSGFLEKRRACATYQVEEERHPIV